MSMQRAAESRVTRGGTHGACKQAAAAFRGKSWRALARSPLPLASLVCIHGLLPRACTFAMPMGDPTPHGRFAGLGVGAAKLPLPRLPLRINVPGSRLLASVRRNFFSTLRGSASPPIAKEDNKETTMHGRTRVDPYHWLKDDNWQQVLRDLESFARIFASTL